MIERRRVAGEGLRAILREGKGEQPQRGKLTIRRDR